MKANPMLYGVKGWLLWMILGLCILGPLWALAQLMHSFQVHLGSEPEFIFNGTWRLYRTLAYGILCLSVCVRWTAGYLLLRVFKPSSVKFAIFTLWISSIGATLLNFGTSYILFNAISSKSALLSQIVQGSLMAGVWTMYLLKSDRVNATYCS